MTQYLKEYGEQLVQLGYTVLPIKPGTKRPDIPDWPRHNTTLEQARKWASNGRAGHGVGINARNTPAIDVDVLDADISAQMARAIEDIFPDAPLLVRTGQAPKFLIPFRSETPFRKLTSKTYTDGKNDHKVEILGDGQQWVAYARHPSGRDYAWFDGIGDEGICAQPVASLAPLSREDALSVIAAFESLAAIRVSEGAWSVKHSAVQVEDERHADPDGDPFAAHAEKTDLTEKQIQWLLNKVDSSSYKQWIDVGMMLHHHFEGSDEGRDVWDEWSEKADNYSAEVIPTHWNSFGQRSDAPLTLRGLMKEVGQPPKEEHKPRAAGSEDDPFPQIEWNSFKQGYEAVPWIIKGLIPQAEVGFLYGPSGCGKTFLALDLAASIAGGIPWRDHKTTQVPVVYVAAEAGEGIKKRMAGYDKTHSPGPRPRIMASVPNFLSSDDAENIVKSTNLRGGAGLIIIDTMAASHTGDENSSKDMALFINHCKDISAKTGAMVLIVHHTGKDSQRGARGHSSLYAAADVVLEVFKDEDTKTSGIEVQKQKDGETGKKFGFSLNVVEVGTDPDGDTITTCVVQSEDEAPVKVKKKTQEEGFETNGRFAKARFYLDLIAGLVGLENAPIAESIVINAIQSNETVNPERFEDFPRPDNIRRTLLTLEKQGKIVLQARTVRLLV